MNIERRSRMTISGGVVSAGLVAAIILSIQGSAAAQGTTVAAPPSETKSAAPAVADTADRLLKEMGGYIGSADQFTFRAIVTFDHVLPTGQKLQFSAVQAIALKRPGRLYVDWDGDLGARELWYDGASVTLHDPATSFYANESMPPAIDGMLDKLIGELNFSPPLADFLYRDPYKAMRGNVQYGFDLGRNEVNGRSCRTLAFVEKDVDWQIWIEDGPQPTPCKLVITYKSQAAQPQFTAIFSDWDFDPRIADAIFAPELPPDSQRIPFATVAASK
jgi:hypothetical protein